MRSQAKNRNPLRREGVDVHGLDKLDRRGARIYLYHLKPSTVSEVKAEVLALERDYLQICELEDVYTF